MRGPVAFSSSIASRAPFSLSLAVVCLWTGERCGEAHAHDRGRLRPGRQREHGETPDEQDRAKAGHGSSQTQGISIIFKATGRLECGPDLISPGGRRILILEMTTAARQAHRASRRRHDLRCLRDATRKNTEPAPRRLGSGQSCQREDADRVRPCRDPAGGARPVDRGRRVHGTDAQRRVRHHRHDLRRLRRAHREGARQAARRQRCGEPRRPSVRELPTRPATSARANSSLPSSARATGRARFPEQTASRTRRGAPSITGGSFATSGLAAGLTLPLVLQMFTMGADHGDMLPRWLQLALATPVQFWFG